MPPPVPQSVRRAHPLAEIVEPVPSLEPEEEPEMPGTVFQTVPDKYRLYCVYPVKPVFEPDKDLSLEQLYKAPTQDGARASATIALDPPAHSFPEVVAQGANQLKEAFAPFLNATVYHLMDWYYCTDGLSLKSLQNLNNTVLAAEDFDKAHLTEFSARCKSQRMDQASDITFGGGWKEGAVEIPLPTEKVPLPEDQAPKLSVGGIWHWPLIQVIKDTFQEAGS